MKIFTDKKLRYGTYSVLMTFIVIAVTVIINLIFSKLNFKFDMSASNVYTLDDKTKTVLSELDESITIYPLFKTGKNEETFAEIISLYENRTNNISVIYKDPYLYPGFTKKYLTDSDIPVGSIIVESEKRFKVIDYNELINYSSDGYERQAESIDLEPQLTGAILYVTMDNVPKIYNVSNHDEPPVPPLVLEKLSGANFEFSDIDIFNLNELPEDCDILMLQTPAFDYSSEEALLINNFLSKDGRAIFLNNISLTDTPNFLSILNSYGVTLENKIITENSSSHSFQNEAAAILPELLPHEITNELSEKNSNVLLYLAQPVTELDLKKPELSVEPLLLTSAESYAALADGTDPSAGQSEDIKGPLWVSAAVTDSYFTDTNHMTKLVVVGSGFFMDYGIDGYVSGNNSDFVLKCIDWLYDEESAVYITPKSLRISAIMFTTSDVNKIAVICCAVIPSVILITGFIIWLRRRNK